MRNVAKAMVRRGRVLRARGARGSKRTAISVITKETDLVVFGLVTRQLRNRSLGRKNPALPRPLRAAWRLLKAEDPAVITFDSLRLTGSFFADALFETRRAIFARDPRAHGVDRKTQALCIPRHSNGSDSRAEPFLPQTE
jgi:hypothetical protein